MKRSMGPLGDDGLDMDTVEFEDTELMEDLEGLTPQAFGQFLDNAHEALSRLYTKSHKRTKREPRKHSWQ